MASIDSAQLYEDKESDCWITIWLVINLSPTCRYRKTCVLPSAFIPGPKKPKILDSFMVIGLHHLSVLQKEGLAVWNSFRNEVLHPNLYLLYTTGNTCGSFYKFFFC